MGLSLTRDFKLGLELVNIRTNVSMKSQHGEMLLQ